jgi:hypothetical protein
VNISEGACRLRVSQGQAMIFYETKKSSLHNLKNVSLRIPTGIMDEIRKLFADENKVSAGLDYRRKC